MAFFVYILQSQSTTRYYIGQTQDIDSRVAYHSANYSKSLKNRGPWQLVYREEYATRSEAIRREREIKSWKDRDMIERLVSSSFQSLNENSLAAERYESVRTAKRAVLATNLRPSRIELDNTG